MLERASYWARVDSLKGTGASNSACISQGEIRRFLKIHFMPNPHPLQVNSWISFLRTLKGFGLVSGFAFPDKELVFARPVLGCRAGNGFDIAAHNLDDLPGGHVVVGSP